MNSNNKLPIQLVIPRPSDYASVPAGGSKKPLCEFTQSLREYIKDECHDLEKYVSLPFREFPAIPCIAKVIMKEKAIAKSHKPRDLFKEDNCPIVGAERLNEVLIKVTPNGIKRLINKVATDSTKSVMADMTKIEKIRIFSSEDKIKIENFASIVNFHSPLKIRLFSLDDKNDNSVFIRGFEKLINDLGLSENIVKLPYSDRLCVYKLSCSEKEKIETLIAYPGLQYISYFSHFSTLRPNIELANNRIDHLPLPDGDRDYPIVGVIDSGISKNHPFLEPWIYEREVYVPQEYQDNTHGTFVAGILEYGHILNGNPLDQKHCKILDVVALPNDDDPDGLSEDRLVEILHDVISRHSNEVKVWNMSLGTENLCKDVISEIAVELDAIQDKYGVEIVLSAGNYQDLPLRSWPPTGNIGENDRLTQPADSMRAIVAGSVTHVGIPAYVGEGMPSPFSRRGPGANFSLKPDVVYDGGNCSPEGVVCGTGVVSFDVSGNLVEGVGTSYSTPAISSIYASLRSSVLEEYAHEYAKAFLIHSSVLPTEIEGHESQLHHYFGFGKPAPNLERIVTCSKSSVTLVFSGELFDGNLIEFNDFPYPMSLQREGKWFGDIKMTLVYTPKLNPSKGQEYCRTNIDAHFGTYSTLQEDGTVVGFKGKVPLEKRWNEGYEEFRVKNGFKWNPIKSYSRSLVRGIDAQPWRLMIDAHARHGEQGYAGQRFVLLITITDPQGADIYSDIRHLLRTKGYLHSDLKIDQRIRQTLSVQQ